MQGEWHSGSVSKPVYSIERTKLLLIMKPAARTLVKNDKGEVIGLIAEKDGKKVAYKARKAVVLCTGGYEYSKTMRQAFLEGPGVEGWAFYGTLYNEGDGIRMGLDAGAGMMKAGKAASRIIMPPQFVTTDFVSA